MVRVLDRKPPGGSGEGRTIITGSYLCQGVTNWQIFARFFFFCLTKPISGAYNPHHEGGTKSKGRKAQYNGWSNY